MRLAFTAHGLPVGQGRISFVGKGRAIHSNARTLLPWRDTVAAHARLAMPLCRWDRFDGPVLVRLAFYLDRPKGHFGAKGLRPSAPHFPHKRPDLDHLQRAIFDALTQAGIWMDDSQVVTVHAAKRYCSPTAALRSPGVIVDVAALPLETYEEDTAA